MIEVTGKVDINQQKISHRNSCGKKQMTVEFFRNSILQEFRSEKQFSMPKYCDIDDQKEKLTRSHKNSCGKKQMTVEFIRNYNLQAIVYA